MARVTEAEELSTQADYAMALAWTRLDALAGREAFLPYLSEYTIEMPMTDDEVAQ
jgi:hypothetical protein